MATLTLTLSIVAIIFSLLGLVAAAGSLIWQISLAKSTHRIEYRNPWGVPETPPETPEAYIIDDLKREQEAEEQQQEDQYEKLHV